MPRNDTVSNIKDFLCLLGFSECSDASKLAGVEKIAIYTDNSLPLHLARQLKDGRWASKLGPLIDVIHTTPEALGGGEYGNPTLFMARRWTGGPPMLPDLHPGRPRLIKSGGGVLIQ